jgi:hypothetical protein
LGIGDNNPFDNGSRFLDNMQWPGTIDQSAYLSVPAIEFQRGHDWDAVRENCHALWRRAIAGIAEITGLRPSIRPTPAHQAATGTRPLLPQMAATPLPPSATSPPSRPASSTSTTSRSRAYPGTAALHPRPIQNYNTADDVEALLERCALSWLSRSANLFIGNILRR